MFLQEVNSLRFLARQGLAFRGHEKEEGNFYQVMNLQAANHHIKHWLSSQKCMSAEILNEIIELMAQDLLLSLLSGIRLVPYYALIADEKRDIAGFEQLADTDTLVSVVKDTLIRCNLSLSKCCGQAYDGASNMSGHISGIAARISMEEPKALYIHCLAHCINLCLQDCAKLCKCIKDALGLVSEIYNLINASPKRLALYNMLKLEHNQDTSSIKPLCPTRWTVRTAAINAVLKNYSLIQQTLDEIANDSTGEPAAKASGLGCLMEKFETFFGLKLSYVAFVARLQSNWL